MQAQGIDPNVLQICQKEGLAGRDLQALSGGQVNAVYRVDGEYVLRIGKREDARARLKRDSDLLRSLAGEIPVPRVYAFGEHNQVAYQIQQFVLGELLYRLWKDLAPAQQAQIAAQLAEYLQILHRRTGAAFGPAGAGHPPAGTWREYFTGHFNQTVNELRALKIRMQPGFIELAQNYLEDHQAVLEDSMPVQVHSDLTLVNILVDQGKISALLDFEFSLQAPRDFELRPMEAFCLYPNDWTEESNEVFCSADFASFLPLLRRFYPALFDIPHLRQRVNLYHLDDSLSSYLAWRKDNLAAIPPEKMAAKDFYMARITNFIFDNGARMFL